MYPYEDSFESFESFGSFESFESFESFASFESFESFEVLKGDDKRVKDRLNRKIITLSYYPRYSQKVNHRAFRVF